MTNLEWLAKNGRYYLLDCKFCEFAYVAKYGKYCPCDCGDCELKSEVEVIKALMEEHKEQNNE